MSESSTGNSARDDRPDGARSLRTISTSDAEHYVWGGVCDGWHLLRTPSLSIISERMPPGATEVAHRHARAQQFFFVLSGELVLVTGHERFVLRAREGMHMPPHVVHQARNESGADVEFIVVSEPPSHGDRVVD